MLDLFLFYQSLWEWKWEWAIAQHSLWAIAKHSLRAIAFLDGRFMFSKRLTVNVFRQRMNQLFQRDADIWRGIF
ncbi:hypothetical protein FHL01_08145 [Cylindrospermopsis raciborskii CS-506_C]|uniref:Uncharacterized protein n=1 Tax=Cylindrospermopsis raciborskii CS-506_A TaxID=2585140 RepID=A0A838WIH4_9CYAN|nr:hypothetical protein [Cylindrospermopsis raciborskii]MBA4445443.1 hypothetical protein [Cylindrospermopsis raciborskii CS-506_C]MBA4456300.1 hypothetical protein [Cylindrospermopsis raciborskii CS-506_B]MBA4465644.1 hypothetical protein [Cylindrospermopsis raciborskii CS-506_A]